MPNKITLRSILSGFNLANINQNFQDIQTWINDKSLSRDIDSTEANSMQEVLDMNQNQIINLPTPTMASHAVNKAYLDGLVSITSDYVTTLLETFTATEGQTVFNFTSYTYTTGADNLTVFVNGVYQSPSRYTETDNNTFTLSEGVDAGDEVTGIINSRAVAADYTPLAGDVEFLHARAGDGGIVLIDGQGTVAAAASEGLINKGRGSIYDHVFKNKNNTAIWRVPTGTTTAEFLGTVSVAGSFSVVGNITGTVNFSDTTDATDEDTASVTFDGGIGVAKKGYFADDIVMADGKGIDFSDYTDGAINSPLVNDNTIKAYEVGAWTPVLTDGSNDATTSVSEGRYIRIGKMVFIYGRIEVTSLGSMSGLFDIEGIPFVGPDEGTSSFMDCANHIMFSLNSNLAAGDFFLTEVRKNGSIVNIGIYDSSTGDIAPCDTSMLSNSVELGFSLYYHTTD